MNQGIGSSYIGGNSGYIGAAGGTGCRELPWRGHGGVTACLEVHPGSHEAGAGGRLKREKQKAWERQVIGFGAEDIVRNLWGKKSYFLKDSIEIRTIPGEYILNNPISFCVINVSLENYVIPWNVFGSLLLTPFPGSFANVHTATSFSSFESWV